MASKISAKDRNITTVSLTNRARFSRTSNVTIVYWHWKKENFGVPSNSLSEAQERQLISEGEEVVTGVINSDIASCNISKNIEHPSASFSVNLLPTKNWRQVIAPGDWVAIYFHGAMETKGDMPEGTKGLVLLGNVDRVSRTIQKDEETDTTQLRYSISGRNFGKVFEQTDIWYDPYHIQDKTLDVMLRKAGLEIAGNPSEQVKAALDVFLGEGYSFKDGRTTGLNQWSIPAPVARLFGASSSKNTFDAILKRDIEPKLPGYNPRNMITPDSNGSLWGFLKRSCNELVNEIYLEEKRDRHGNVKPTIALKPRPFNTPFLDSHFGGEAGMLKSMIKYKTLQRLAEDNGLEISQSEVIYENLGRDDHSRINMLWLQVSQQYQYLLSPTANVNSKNTLGNPTFSRPSIRRHGLRRMDSILEFCHAENNGKEARGVGVNINLFKAFIGQLYDMNYANHLYEQGTIECTGVLEAELGKALVVKSISEGVPDKVYFIEGYEHKWSFPNTWTTTFTVTKGQFKTNDLNIFIDVLGKGDFGRPDDLIGLSFVAKTEGKR